MHSSICEPDLQCSGVTEMYGEFDEGGRSICLRGICAFFYR